MSVPGSETKKVGRLQFQVTNGGHSVLTDVNEKLGGQNQGMNPHELLESALAACTAITMQMYADKKFWRLEYADVHVKILSEGAVTQMSRIIDIHGELSEEQRTRLLEIADKCPIHKILTGQISITTSLS